MIGMLKKRWKAWREGRAAERRFAEFRRGYQYARGALASGEESPLSLQCYTDTSRGFGDYSHFDSGVEVAIAKAVADGLVADNRLPY
jgi:hypothetical protein